MARYVAASPIALPSGIVAEGVEFESDEVPGMAWTPLDKEAEKAVAKANSDRIERKAAKAVVKGEKADEKPTRRDPMVFQLRKEVDTLNAEVAELKAMLEELTAPPRADLPADPPEEDPPEGEGEA